MSQLLKSKIPASLFIEVERKGEEEKDNKSEID